MNIGSAITWVLIPWGLIPESWGDGPGKISPLT